MPSASFLALCSLVPGSASLMRWPTLQQQQQDNHQEQGSNSSGPSATLAQSATAASRPRRAAPAAQFTASAPTLGGWRWWCLSLRARPWHLQHGECHVSSPLHTCLNPIKRSGTTWHLTLRIHRAIVHSCVCCVAGECLVGVGMASVLGVGVLLGVLGRCPMTSAHDRLQLQGLAAVHQVHLQGLSCRAGDPVGHVFFPAGGWRQAGGL